MKQLTLQEQEVLIKRILGHLSGFDKEEFTKAEMHIANALVDAGLAIWEKGKYGEHLAASPE